MKALLENIREWPAKHENHKCFLAPISCYTIYYGNSAIPWHALKWS